MEGKRGAQRTLPWSRFAQAPCAIRGKDANKERAVAEFKSSLFKHLAAAADIPYNPNLPADEVVYRDPDGEPVKFTNDDQRRLDAMKTAIIKVLFLRASNYMINNKEDPKDKPERKAYSEFSIEFVDQNVRHKDQPPAKVELFDLPAVEASLKGTTAQYFGTNGRPKPSSYDNINGTLDLEIATLLLNFRGDVMALVRKPVLTLNCP